MCCFFSNKCHHFSLLQLYAVLLTPEPWIHHSTFIWSLIFSLCLSFIYQKKKSPFYLLFLSLLPIVSLFALYQMTHFIYTCNILYFFNAFSFKKNHLYSCFHFQAYASPDLLPSTLSIPLYFSVMMEVNDIHKTIQN